MLMAETEPNRNWAYKDLKTGYTKTMRGRTFIHRGIFIHINWGLKAVLRELKPDILVCAGSYLCPGIWQALKWKKKFHYDILYWSESHLNEQRSYSRFRIWARETLRKTVYKRFDGFWYAGKLSRQFIEKYSRPDSKMFFVQNLVDDNAYQRAGEISVEKRNELRNKLGVGLDRVVFICPARLSPVKGIDKFVDLMGKCRNKNNTTILIAGDGELRDLIENKATICGLDIRLLGVQPQSSIIDLYSMSDIFLLPSISDPNPLTCIEALWAGLPLFISNHCGNYPEVVVNGVNGYVFNYAKENEAISYLEYIIDNEPWRKSASEKSKLLAKERYDSKVVVKRIVSEMREMIK